MLNDDVLTHLSSEDAETIVLGTLLMYPEQIDELYVKEEFFFSRVNQCILAAMNDVNEKGFKIDVPTVLDYVTSKGNFNSGDIYERLKYLSSQAFTTQNFIHQQNKIMNLYKKREQAKILQDAMNNLLDDETDVTHEKVVTKFEYLNELTTNDEDDGHISKVMEKIFENLQRPTNYLYSKTHFTVLDNITNGLKRKDLVILGARPSMGKTAFAMGIGQNHSLKGDGPTLVVSIEMPSEGIGTRMLSSEGHIDGMKFKDANERLTSDDWQRVVSTMGELSKSKMHLFDDSSVTVEKIKRKSRMVKALYPGEHLVIIIDYLQLIEGDKKYGGNRTQEISGISRGLKAIAKELDATVIALSQLSRGVEQRQDKRPVNSDLRESGQIEQDADVIMLLYRDDYYDKDSESKGVIEILVTKNRDGGIGTAHLGFKKEYSKFVNIDWDMNKGV